MSLTNPYQQTGRERNRESASIVERSEPDGRFLVRRALVRLPWVGKEPATHRLEHETHRWCHWSQAQQLVPRHDARVQVWQQPGLFKYEHRHGPQVVKGAGVASGIQPLSCLWPPFLWPVTECEERFFALLCRPSPGDLENLVRRQEGG